MTLHVNRKRRTVSNVLDDDCYWRAQDCRLKGFITLFLALKPEAGDERVGEPDRQWTIHSAEESVSRDHLHCQHLREKWISSRLPIQASGSLHARRT